MVRRRVALLFVDPSAQGVDMLALKSVEDTPDTTPTVLVSGAYSVEATLELRDRLALSSPTTPVYSIGPSVLYSPTNRGIEAEIQAQAIRELGADIVVCNSFDTTEAVRAALLDTSDANVTQTDGLQLALGVLHEHAPVQPEAQPTGSKPQLAFVTPWVPQMTGIARHAVVTHKALAAFYDITVVAEPGHEQTDGVEFLSPGEFAKNPSRFDRIVYQMGNSPYHEFILPFLVSIPGVVVMHDGQFTEWFRPTRGEDSAEYRTLCYREGGLRGWINAEMTGVDLVRPSLGLIVHSANAASRLTTGPAALPRDFIRVAALADNAVIRPSRQEARATLNISNDTVLIATFGRVHPSKRNVEFLEVATEAARQTPDETHVHIAVVGAEADEDYMTTVKSYADSEVTVTDAVAADEFSAWVAATDIAVQLRSEDHGESSGALVEAMSGQAAVVVENRGAMAELLGGTGVVIDTPFVPDQLTTALRRLIDDPDFRHELGQKSAELAGGRHSNAAIGEQYQDIIESHYRQRDPHTFIERMSRRAEPLDVRREAVSRAAYNRVDREPDRLVVELTEIVDGAAVSGIQRVEERLGQELIPVWPGRTLHASADQESLAETVKVAARGPAADIANPRDLGRLEGRSDDWLFSARFFPDADLWRRRLDSWRAHGGRVAHMVCDLFPVTNPEWFPPYAVQHFPNYLNLILESSDLVVSISKGTMEELIRYIESDQNTVVRDRPLDLSWVRLGFDMESQRDSAERISARSGWRRVLMVSTVEPRKGYVTALNAFKELWNRGSDVELTIVGRRGWGPESLFSELDSTAGEYDRFTWLSDCSDAELEDCYLGSDLLLAASENEGFGLPLIEAANYALPVLARDIPIFHEVAGASARYFADASPNALADAILNALDQGPTNEPAPPSTTWKATAEQVVASLTGERVHARWEPASGVKWL